ncbi:MAG: hypothetical protein AAF560_29110 [Acidobacteriota bacterium]
MTRRWVVNASPLILLGKVDQVRLLQELSENLNNLVQAALREPMKIGRAIGVEAQDVLNRKKVFSIRLVVDPRAGQQLGFNDRREQADLHRSIHLFSGPFGFYLLT